MFQQDQVLVDVNLPRGFPVRSGAPVCSLCRDLVWAITVNKVIQPWSDLESKIKAGGGCSERSRRISQGARRNCAISIAATAWTTGLGVWSDGRRAICSLRGERVPSHFCCVDAGCLLTYRASSISLVLQKTMVVILGLWHRRFSFSPCCGRAAIASVCLHAER